MTKLSSLPLVALVSLGLAACGGAEDDSAAERTADRMEERADAIEDRADEIEDEVDDMDLDDDAGMMAADDEMMGNAEVMVTVRGVQPDGGQVYVTLQTPNEFPNGASRYGKAVDADGDSVTVMFDGVASGSYAAAAFQDTDGNGSLAMGTPAPREPWGFSGYSGGAPKFDQLMFEVSDSGANAEVTLNQ